MHPTRRLPFSRTHTTQKKTKQRLYDFLSNLLLQCRTSCSTFVRVSQGVFAQVTCVEKILAVGDIPYPDNKPTVLKAHL